MKEGLDWDDDSGEGGAGYTTLIYQVTPDEQSELLDMTAVLGLVQSGDIQGDTLVWTEGMDGWLEFDDAKGSFEWPEVAADDEEEGLFYELEGGESSDKLSAAKFLEVSTAHPRPFAAPAHHRL